MFSRSIIRLTLALIIVVASLLLVTSITATAAAPTTDTRPHTDLIVNPGESIQAAIDAANDGDTIIVNAGDYTESLTLSKPVSLTGVNSDTTILHAVAGQRVLTVTGATISNSVVISGLTFTGGQANYGGGVLITSTAQPLIQNVIITGNVGGFIGGLYSTAPLLTLIDTDFINNLGGGALAYTTTVMNGRFINNTGSIGGLAVQGALTSIGTQFVGNIAFDGGGASVRNGPVIIINGRFENNSASDDSGGGLYASEAVTLTNVEFISNTAQQSGGGFACGFYFCSLNIANTIFVSNTAGEGGGGLYSEAGPIVLAGSRFEGNVSHYFGGGLMRSQCCDMIYMTDTQFISNTAVGMYGGGGAFAGPVTINGGRFERNVSTFSGGGGLFGAGTISGTSFISNLAITAGGFYGSGTIINARFEGNQSTIQDDWLGGGGAASVGGGPTVISQTRFINNFSATRGGAVLAQAANELTIIDSLFINNAAREGTAVGDVSYLSGIGNISLIHTTIADTQLNPTSAVSVLSFTAQLTDTIIANHAIGISNTGGTVTEDYNLFYGNLTNTVGVITGTHSLIGDPRFVDPVHDDYHLAFGSAAIDRGVETGVYTDLDGHPRPIGPGFDIGAYEYQLANYIYLPLIQK